MDFSKSGLALALGATAFVGYCVYFDYKRRSATDYKQKIRENRRLKEGKANGIVSSTGAQRRVPSFADPMAMQQFFSEEMQLGEELLAQGQVGEGVEHLSNALVLCGSSGGAQQLLALMQESMPPSYFEALIQQIPAAQGRIQAMISASEDAIDKSVDQAIQTLVDDDLE